METIIYLGLGLMGVLAHCLMKAQSLIKDAKVANVKFGFKDYLNCDWFGIGISFIAVFIWLFIFEEVAQKYTAIQGMIRISFVLMGLAGSYLIQAVFSRAKGFIRNVIDKKTDIADEIVANDIGGGGIKNPPK